MREVVPASVVPSPCVSICRMASETALCEGCFRTIPEIAGWRHMSDDEKRAVWVSIDQRVAQKESAKESAKAKDEAPT